MARVCLVLVAGLDREILERTAGLGVMGGMKGRGFYEPVLPAVTCTAQATLTTGVDVSGHGIVGNGLYTHGNAGLRAKLDLSDHAEARVNVSFWEQSNALLERPRFWTGMGKKVAMLFWQQSIGGGGAAEIVITPKPEHTADGKTVTACWSSPTDLYATLVKELGPFPLHNYWSPMAGLPSSQWIAKSAEHVWKNHTPDLQLVYIPHLDFNLQRLGPDHPAIIKDLRDVDALLAPLAERVRADGGTMVIAGDYGVSEVSTVGLPNVVLREAGLLSVKADAAEKLLVDYERSAAFAMADHQIAHVYVREGRVAEVEKKLAACAGVEKVVRRDSEEAKRLGLDHERSGDLILLAEKNAWFAHDWWLTDAEKPAWQFGVDIHNKPGYDPRELFFDRERKCIAQDPALVKGSHGRTDDRAKWPVLLSDVALPAASAETGEIHATAIASWLGGLLT